MKPLSEVDRRTFFKRFAQFAGAAAFGAGAWTGKPGPARGSSAPESQDDPRWRPLLSVLKRYVTYAYIEYDRIKANAALETLNRHGLTSEDVIPLQKINRHLLPKEMFLTFFYVESPTIIPVAKVFIVVKRDVFNGFTVNGVTYSSLYGEELDSYDRVLLGNQVYSSAGVPPIALAYDLSAPGSQRPAWVIAIPSEWIESLYGNRPGGVQERLVEELTIHEIAHIMHRTRDELIPFLAQFGYRIGGDRCISCIEDLIEYLHEERLTYHQIERFILERIDNADAYYGNYGNRSHLSALKEIKDGLEELSKQVNKHDPTFSKHIIRMSDQQCWGSMALLYYRAVQKKSAVS